MADDGRQSTVTGSDAEQAARRKPRVALALGAGGAKGLAHIGAIEEILAQGLDIVAIAGTSMGALIGGIHATGKMDVYRDWVTTLAKMDVLKLVDWSFTGGGLIKGDKIIGVMRELIGDVNIEDLPLPYTAVAVDLEREREAWLVKGSLFDAIRASIAIPSLMRPYRLDGRVLVDGALLNPVPVTPLIREPADFLIAVSIDGPVDNALHAPAVEAVPDSSSRPSLGDYLSRFNPLAGGEAKPREPGMLELLSQSLDMMQANLARVRLVAYPPDLLIELPRNISSVYEFYRAQELIELGRLKAREALAGWLPTALAQRGY